MATHPLPLPPGGKVRLVRCPKCRGLLPELPNVPLYKCGGCGATLRAKIPNEPPAASIPDHANESENSSSPSQATKLTPTIANPCLTSPISDPKRCFNEEETNKHNTSSPNAELDCRGRKQVSDAEEVDNGNDGSSSPDVSQGYTANSSTHCPAADGVLLSPDILFGDSDRPSSQTDSEQSQDIVCRDSDHSCSRDQMETGNTQVIMDEEEMQIPSSMELSNNHDNDMPELEEEEKLGAKTFHTYEGSVSSYEGRDDQLHHHQHIRKYTYEFDDSSGEQITTDDVGKMNPKVPLPLRSRKFRTMSFNDDQAKTRMENSVESNQELPADIINGNNEHEKLLNSESFHTAQTSTQSQRMSDKDFYRKVLPAAFENGGSYSNKEFMYDSDSHPVEKAPSVHNQDELLRKVDELRDRLIKSYALKLETRNDKFLKGGGTHQQEHERPMYSNHAQQRQKDPSCYRRNDPWHFSGACPPSNSVPFQGRNSSQIPRCNVGYTSLQCCPEQFQYPLQRPPVAKGCYSEQLCQIHPGYMCYHPCGSGPVNNSNFAPRICNSQPLPHGQRHIDHTLEKQNLYLHRDRRNHIKRHCLPVAGGAPIIVCYSCKILLQLPADFILSSDRCTKLRCSSCSELLIFQLRSGRSVPFRPNPPTVPPPSEVDSRSNSTSRRSWDFSVSKENNRNRDESSVLDETSRTNSRRILLEKRLHGKEVQRTSGSPLHSLMGYPSPRRLLIKRSSDIDQER
ncbi:hypothetical protein C5167_014827 [Papaver somniferum]|uniref:Uncharacterized protein n=1 Tax=Papaver somniferum TaxID=3469 RepID=A0A4Y7J880_PAPSO|nr:protein ENHANCED DISEASE RESISTANCE 4-like [Papaver somniferum]RZC55978.1 hypothetical protein C5167_014827 [Papaver somniferum]